MESVFFKGMKSDHPLRPREQNGLDRPSERLAERGNYGGHVAKTSLYTVASLHPVLAGATIVGAVLAVVALWHAL